MTEQGQVEYPAGMDVEWVAVDRKGRLAVFTGFDRPVVDVSAAKRRAA